MRTTEYVPAGVPRVNIVFLLPQPASPTAHSMRKAMEIRRRLDMHIIMVRLPKHKIAVCAKPLQGKLSRPLVIPAAVVRAVVVIVTENGIAAEPLTLNGLGLTE